MRFNLGCNCLCEDCNCSKAAQFEIVVSGVSGSACLLEFNRTWTISNDPNGLQFANFPANECQWLEEVESAPCGHIWVVTNETLDNLLIFGYTTLPGTVVQGAGYFRPGANSIECDGTTQYELQFENVGSWPATIDLVRVT